MKFSTFKGGVHPPEKKDLSKDIPISKIPLPERLIIPIQQHTGAPAEPLVKPKSYVYKGQKIGDKQAFVTSPIHAPTSGTVKRIGLYPHSSGELVTAIEIEVDGKEELYPDLPEKVSWENLSPDEIRQRIREAGIVGLGGAAFPTHVKITPPSEKKIDTIILNGAECEPYLTIDYRLMLEKPELIIQGLKILMYVVGAKKGIIGIEENKKEAANLLRNYTDRDIEIALLYTKYPQGSEKHLIKALLNREVPSGGLPLDVGVIVNNVGTACAIAEHFNTGLPLISRGVTVSGEGVNSPKNLDVLIGTPVSKLIETAGGFREEPGKIIFGGPMMGVAIYNLETPIIKGTSGVVVFRKKDVKYYEPMTCVRCGRCVDVCPMGIIPTAIASYVEKEKIVEAEELGALDCIECGSCNYTCPSRRPLLQWIRMGKAEILAKKRK
ncbi:MAG TPA: electron transport complex subunit RsxC [Dictyoglomaceae bacterium]|nr:electron transport complex subunit RsxC [Dictyoglomaceae bacterium]HOL38728.1 electron transport complex subunit RsxC [Dictyoglomaceae bacterium]HOP94568.1 electron transport complex subunit RsxC [Dictyoglomaceae bacterium]HPP15523.1 electron transport complex subunit RsxC [Dictyoglomaceae bacterium]HPU42838.1 electron transport complex subunit RsxC [Dictyoglomaceae bacterium]